MLPLQLIGLVALLAAVVIGAVTGCVATRGALTGLLSGAIGRVAGSVLGMSLYTTGSPLLFPIQKVRREWFGTITQVLDPFAPWSTLAVLAASTALVATMLARIIVRLV